MALPSALARFMEARAAVAGRASAFSIGRSADAICQYLADCLDAALVQLASADPGVQGFALVAVGGYGRRELARHSDVDVMLLVEDDALAERAVRLLYPLWDAALKVGHSVRTIPQVSEAARANVETFTAILDARLLAGSDALYTDFVAERRRLVRRSQDWLRQELADRRAEVTRQTPWQLQAVDLKTGRGGLRDLHAMHWLAAAEGIAAGGDGTGGPRSHALAEAHELLLLTRHAVHSTSERPGDTFRPETAHEVARWLEADPLGWARELYATMRVVDAAASEVIRPPEAKRPWWARARTRAAPQAAEPADPSPIAILRRTLREADGRRLEPLAPAPWLDRLLPEWDGLRARPHVAPFHIHPVDVHVMRTVAEARAVLEGDEFEPGAPEVGRRFGRPDELLLAAFLHDIGKAHAGIEHPAAGAIIAERFASRAGLPAPEAARLVAAVRHHLLLPAVATRRDIADPEVIRETAEVVGDADTLRLLYLLAIADARASGPNVWNQWKAQLMRSLFHRVMALLEAEGATATPDIDDIIAALAPRFPEQAVRDHLAGLEAGYVVSTPPAAIGDHLALIEQAATAEGGAAARRERLGEIDRLTLVCPDRPGLMQDIAGTLAGFNANLLGGVAYTRADGIAIEVWHVGDALGVGIDDRRWARILDAIPAAARGEFDIEERLEEVRRSYPQPPRRRDIQTRVQVDNRASREYSVLEVSAPDRRGLLYAVTKALHDMRIDIHLAKVDTIGPEVFDAFYIQRESGARIEESDEIDRLTRRIEGVLAVLD